MILIIDHDDYIGLLHDCLSIDHSGYLGIVHVYALAYDAPLGMFNVLKILYDVKVGDVNEINGWLSLGIYLRHVHVHIVWHILRWYDSDRDNVTVTLW